MKIYFFEVENWEKIHIERRLKEKNIDAEVKFLNEELDNTNVKNFSDAEIISVFIYSKITKDVIDSMPNLKYIVTRSTGFDHIDIEYAKKKGIKVSNVPGYGNNTVAEYTFGLILALARKFKTMILNIERGDFSRQGLMGIDIMGKTIGIIGTGRIGSYVAKIAHGFGMNILAYDRSKKQNLIEQYGVKYVGLEELLSNSDIVTLHVPYTKSTHHLINRFNIKLMKLDAMLINTSRGPVVETEAIIEALREGRLSGGVALDTFEAEDVIIEEEFLKKEHLPATKLKKALEAYYVLRQENVIVSPHNAYNTRDALQRILDITVDNIESFLKGNPENIVA
ncbi:hydroxyacid dehydrogenase [Hydrogenothermus marinus]|uniref:D-lactate dehydrogenase n=1 Tax=Hydrogenothermus marinus TaxID=133270 RepID=A0A3M0BN33_9AQUI|nr:hydroxyacid dehydrogenase [Hydrogenothermus marinus]RMA97936.1 D-lactate dehydrogenase [Hydrogenothermus marinus]